MANVRKTGTFTLNATDTYILGDAGDGVVSTYMVHLVSSSFSGTIVVKSRGWDNDLGTASTPAFVAIPYYAPHLNGSAGTYGTGSSANITDTSLLLIPASGQQIALDCTAYTSGSMTVRVVPLIGAAS